MPRACEPHTLRQPHIKPNDRHGRHAQRCHATRATVRPPVSGKSYPVNGEFSPDNWAKPTKSSFAFLHHRDDSGRAGLSSDVRGKTPVDILKKRFEASADANVQYRWNEHLSFSAVPFTHKLKRLGTGEGYVDEPVRFAKLAPLGWPLIALSTLLLITSAAFNATLVEYLAFVGGLGVGLELLYLRWRERRFRRVLLHADGVLSILVTTPRGIVSEVSAPLSECVLLRHKAPSIGSAHALVVWVADQHFTIAAHRSKDRLADVQIPAWLRAIDKGEGPSLDTLVLDAVLWGGKPSRE